MSAKIRPSDKMSASVIHSMARLVGGLWKYLFCNSLDKQPRPYRLYIMNDIRTSPKYVEGKIVSWTLWPTMFYYLINNAKIMTKRGWLDATGLSQGAFEWIACRIGRLCDTFFRTKWKWGSERKAKQKCLAVPQKCVQSPHQVGRSQKSLEHQEMIVCKPEHECRKSQLKLRMKFGYDTRRLPNFIQSIKHQARQRGAVISAQPSQ